MAAACVLACAIPAVAAPAVPGCPGRDATGPDAWTTIRPRIGGRTGAPIVDIAVLPLDPDVIYATDGKAVAMSRNGGCTWRDVAGANTGLPAVASRQIVAIDVSQRSTDGVTTVWLLSNVTLAGTSRPEVLVAEDGELIEPDAREWALGGTPVGLPLGNAVALAAGTDPDYAYAVVSVPGAGRQLLATQNRGGLWEPRATVGSDARGVAADSFYPNRIWTWGLDGLFASVDGGATLTPVESVPGPVSDVSVAQSPKGTRILVLQPNGLLWRSDDGGDAFTSIRVDVRTSSVAAVPVVDVAAAAGREIATVFPAIFTPYDVSPRGEVWFDDLAASLQDGKRVFVLGRTQDVLRVREVDVDLRYVPPPPGDKTVDLRGPVERIPLFPALNPRASTVTLAPGETRDVDYRLELPATPTPIDVHFVVDTTGSMQPVIDALRQALAKIVNDLTAAGIEANFGVGDFRDVPRATWGSSGDHIYKLLRRIGPVDEELEQALNALQAGGGGDGPEALQFATYEAVRHAAGMRSYLDVPEGDTAWRQGALHMAILATDTSSHTAGEAGSQGEIYPGPDYDALVTALLKARVLVMGISSSDDARSSISEMAYDSGAVAPVPIDCNGDGRPDIPEGEPLVCPFQPGAVSNVPVPTPVDPLLGGGAKNMSSAVLAMLRGVHDPAAVTVRSSRPDVARVLTGPLSVDMKTANALPVRVRYTCSAERYGSTIAVRLPAYAASRQVTEAVAEVRCAAPPGHPAPPPPPARDLVVPPAAPRPVPAVAVAPPPPPPAPVSQVQPHPNPHPNVNLQPGAAAQEEQQFQLALAVGDVGPAQEESLAMSRADDTLPAAGLLCAGVVMAGAAYGLQHRRRTQVARARY
jgi:hypothetical protein